MIARLVASHHLSPDIKHFVFEVAEPLVFRAGQFVSLSHDFPGKRITRAYSTAAPANANRFELCLNLVPEGRFSPFLFAMQPGDTVEMEGPLGTFHLRDNVRDTYLVATGTGIAPFRAMLLDALPKHPSARFTLVFGARHEHGLVYRAEFDALAAAHANFDVHYTLTQPPADWNHATGRVQPLLSSLLADRRDVDVFLCGMKAMVDETRQLLKERGFDRKQIIVEKYD